MFARFSLDTQSRFIDQASESIGLRYQGEVLGLHESGCHTLSCLVAALIVKDDLFMNGISFRLYRPDDLEAIKELTLESFGGVTIEENIEASLGILNGHDWRWRKARHIDEDVAANPSGIFIAESDGRLVGYITTRIDREAGKGRIPNLAVVAEFRGKGLGRKLIEHALAYFRAEKLVFAVIETMAQNAIGQHLYPACGFVEVARQAHFARKL